MSDVNTFTTHSLATFQSENGHTQQFAGLINDRINALNFMSIFSAGKHE